MPPIVVGSAFDLAWAEREEGLRSIQGLNLRFLIHAEDERICGRCEVQPDDVSHLLNQEWIGRKLEALATVRLKAERPPDSGNCHVAQAKLLGHAPGTPMRRTTRRRLQGCGYDSLDHSITDLAGRAGPLFIRQSIETMPREPRSPLSNRLAGNSELLRYLAIVQSLGACENHRGSE